MLETNCKAIPTALRLSVLARARAKTVFGPLNVAGSWSL